MKLVIPSEELYEKYAVMAKDYEMHKDSRYTSLSKSDYVDFIKQLDKDSREVKGPGRVTYTTFWLLDDENQAIVGNGRLRHYLVKHLENEGGHIGYVITPSHRKKGYGKLILDLLLDEARKINIKEILITCDKDNIGSKKIIEYNGGILIDEVISHESGKDVLRFRIIL